MGEDGFGPSKLKSNRFTVCPLWPLGNSPITDFQEDLLPEAIKWSWWTDSNPRPADYKTAALPTELHQLELLSFVDCLIIISHLFLFVKYFFEIFQIFLKFLKGLKKMVEATGLEPAASWSQTKHSTKLSYASFKFFGCRSLTTFILYTKEVHLSSSFFQFVGLHNVTAGKFKNNVENKQKCGLHNEIRIDFKVKQSQIDCCKARNRIPS